MGALTELIPKPMLQILGRPALEYVFDSLPDAVDEVVLVVGYLGHTIQQHFGGSYQGKRILYVEQAEMNGTAGALWAAKDLLEGKFLVMNGDDICLKQDVTACADSPDWAVLVQKVEEIGSAGKVILGDDGCVSDILEKEAHEGGPGIANTANLFSLDTRIFGFLPVFRPGNTTEYGLPQTVVQAVGEIPLHPVEAHSLIRLTSPEDIATASEMLS